LGEGSLKVLEVGCGTAIDASILAEDSRLEVVGVDRAWEAVQVAARISASFKRSPKFIVGDAKKLCFPKETFDLVFSQGFLEHFRDPASYLKEQVRVLKHSGHLVVDVPQKYAGLGTYSLRKQWKIRGRKWPWGWETQYSYPEIKKMGKTLGLIPRGVAGYGFDGFFNLLANPHLMIDKKPLLRDLWLAQKFKVFYLRHLKGPNDRLWGDLCRRWGHWFLICVVVRFKKP
jgi:SAM-dependent methyltransferase